MHRALYRLGLGILVLFVGTGLGAYPVWADPFPQYEVIRPNVDFWIKVYTQYDSTQAIVHDSENLDIVYGVVDLVADTAAGSRKINRGRMKRAREFYRAVLARLAARPPMGARVLGQIGARLSMDIRLLGRRPGERSGILARAACDRRSWS